MLERMLFEYYRIYPEHVMCIGDDYVILSEGKQYLVRPVEGHVLKELEEIKTISDWLIYHGDADIATFVISHENKVYFKFDGQYFLIFQIPSGNNGLKESEPLGRRLAFFHQKGFNYYREDGKKLAWVSWKNRWEKRVDQLENWYVSITRSKTKTEIDEMFCITFPYFLGVCENAIQMIGELFFQFGDTPFLQKRSICHRRFCDDTWLTLEEGRIGRVKIPTDFIFDHYVRDVADYVRSLWIEENRVGVTEDWEQLIHAFLNEYESVNRFTLYDQMLLFIRLLFPLHYFETVEQYYQVHDRREKELLAEKCDQVFSNTRKDEQLLHLILSRYPNLKSEMLLPDWLQER